MDIHESLHEVSKALCNQKDDNILEKLSSELSDLLDANEIERTSFQVKYCYCDLQNTSENTTPSKNTSSIQANRMLIKVICENQQKSFQIRDILEKKYYVSDSIDFYLNQRSDGYKSIHLIIQVESASIQLQINDIVNELKMHYCYSRIFKNNLIKEEAKMRINALMSAYIDEYIENQLNQNLLSTNDIKNFDTKLNSIILSENSKNLSSSIQEKLAEVIATVKNKSNPSTKSLE